MTISLWPLILIVNPHRRFYPNFYRPALKIP